MRPIERIKSAIKQIKPLCSLYMRGSNIIKQIETKCLLRCHFGISYSEFLQYKREIKRSNLLNDLREKKQWFIENVVGMSYTGHQRVFGSGKVTEEVGICLYSIIRKRKPSILVETGVCAGFSTSFILLAIKENKKGKLYSIDYPEYEGGTYNKDSFYAQKRGATVPKGRESGWAIPAYLKQNWKLILGKSQEKLPLLLEELKSIDLFLHDGEHSYECMWFEFNEAFSSLKDGGLLLSDDIDWNKSFYDFCKMNKRKIIKINQIMGIIVK